MVRLALVMLAVTSASFAALLAPEVDANMGVSAISVLAGGALVLRSRFGKRK